MKKMLAMLVVALGVSSLFAAQYTDEKGRTWLLSNYSDTKPVSGEPIKFWKLDGCYPLPKDDFTVPAKLGDFTIHGIASYAFTNATEITSVTISEGIKRIGQCAFGTEDPAITTKLDKVSLPVGLEYVHGNAFRNSKIWFKKVESGWVQDGYLIKYMGTNETYTVPADVKLIAVYAFRDVPMTNGVHCLKQINFQEGLEEIQDYAFQHKTGIGFAFGDVVLPDSLKLIDNGAFNKATFKSLKLGKGITDLEKKVGIYRLDGTDCNFSQAFSSSRFESIDFGDGVESIPGSLFSYKTTLKSVRFGAALRAIGYEAFNTCTQLTNVDFTAATALESIGSYAFRSTKLSSIDLSKCTMLKEIPDYCFYGCKSLRDIKFNEGLQTIGSQAFDSYDAYEGSSNGLGVLGSLRFPASLKTIGYRAFYGSTNLCEVVLNEGLEVIGSEAFGMPVYYYGPWGDFYANSMLTNVVIPASVTTLGDSVFNACSNLWKIAGGDNVDDFSGAFGELVPAFASVEFAEDGKTPLPFQVLKFGKTALGFQGQCRSELTADDFGDIDTIREGAFAGWNESVSNLVSVAFPATLERIEGNAFYRAANLSTVGFGDTTNLSIGYNAFKGTAIKELTGEFANIGSFAFADCPALTKVDISVASVSEDDEGNSWSFGGIVNRQAFASCTNLETAVINALGEIEDDWMSGEIDGYVFDRCSALKSATVTASRISQDAFKWMDDSWNPIPVLAPQTVTIDVPEICDEMFADMTNLTAVTFGALVERIGADAFNGCSNLVTVAQTEGGVLKQIDEYAFLGTKFYNEAAAGALKLGSMLVKWTGEEEIVTIPDDIEYIASSAFIGSKAVKVIVPTKVGVIRPYTFENCQNLAQVEFKNREIRLASQVFAFIPDEGYWDYVPAPFFNNGCPLLTAAGDKALIAPNRGAFILKGWLDVYGDDAFGESYRYRTPDYQKLAFHNDASADGDFKEGSSYTGWIMNGSDAIVGTVTVKTGKRDKNDEVKVTMTVQLAGVKKNYTAMFKIDENGKAVATDAAANQFSELAGMYLGGTWLSGSVRLANQTYTVRGANSSKDALAGMDGFAGHVWGAALTSYSGIVPVVNGYSGLSISVAKNGKVKVSGTLADGQKISATAQMAAGDNGVYAAPFYVQTNGKKGGFGFVIDFYMDGESPRAWFQEYDDGVGYMTNWQYPLEFGVSTGENAATFEWVDIYPIGDHELFEIDPKGNGLAEGAYFVRWVGGTAANAELALNVSSKSPFVVIEQDSSIFDRFTDLTVDEKGKWQFPKATKVKLATEKDLESYQDDIVDQLPISGSLTTPSFECVTKDGKILEAYEFDHDELLGTYTPTAYLLCDIGTKVKDDKFVAGENTNFYGMKLGYAKKTGLVNGSSVYYWVDVSKADKPTLKKGKTSVSGIVLDGAIYGASTVKGVATIALGSEKAN